MIKISSILLASYFLGCITTGYYLVRLMAGKDIRTVSSGNLGSRNVGRLLGVKGFLLTFIGDAGKGVLAVWLARQFSAEAWVVVAALLAAVAGHIWPVQLRFQGGKGMATFLGGMILLQPMILLISLASCALVYPFLKGTTKTGLVALTVSPIFMLLLLTRQDAPFQHVQMLLYCVMVVIMLYAHRSNIRRDFFGHTG